MSRVTSQFFVDSFRARLDMMAIPYYLHKKGDANAGVIFIECNDELRALRYDYERDKRLWEVVACGTKIASYLENEARFDPDYWYIEAEDGALDHLSDEGL